MQDNYKKVHNYKVDDIRTVADLKRLKERHDGDSGFRAGVSSATADRSSLLADLGIGLSVSDLEHIWIDSAPSAITPELKAAMVNDPLLKLWSGWNENSNQKFHNLAKQWSIFNNQPLTAWRSRWMQRFTSESTTEGLIINPLFSFELSKGCTVGCWFCGLAAEKFDGFFAYMPKNVALWRDILQVSRDFAGTGVKSALCYHGTEPFDNPGYLNFLRDFQDVIGALPQTTTAIPLQNIEKTREMLYMRESCLMLPDRFSVLSLNVLKKIHRTFTPFELRYVDLVLHNSGALAQKTNCGRAQQRPEKLKRANRLAREIDPDGGASDPNSIECLCGYLVNMVAGTIQLVSPCRASARWPNGYRVHVTGSFSNGEEFKAFLEKSVQKHMPENMDWGDKIAFRPGLAYDRVGEGFTLTSRRIRNALKGKPWHGELGDIISQGSGTAGEAITNIAAGGVALPDVIAAVQKLFNKGLLADITDEVEA